MNNQDLIQTILVALVAAVNNKDIALIDQLSSAYQRVVSVSK